MSASAALTTTMRRIGDKVRSVPLCCCVQLFGLELIKKCMPARSASRLRFVQISCIGVDIKDHAACGVANCGVWVGDIVVEELEELHIHVLCGRCLLICEGADGFEDRWVYGLAIVDEGSDDLLNPRIPC
jgi:hypothetical protein